MTHTPEHEQYKFLFKSKKKMIDNKQNNVLINFLKKKNLIEKRKTEKRDTEPRWAATAAPFYFVWILFIN